MSKDQKETGLLEGESLKGFLGAPERLGLQVDDPQAFVKAQQQAVFEWAKTAPDELDVPETGSDAASGGPRFVHYFAPVLEALRACGGEVSPDQVLAWVKEHGNVPVEEVEGVTKGPSTLEVELTEFLGRRGTYPGLWI